MATYYIDEASFVLPERGFVDRTLHRLESPLPANDALTIEIRRLPMAVGKSLVRLLDEELATKAREVSGFILVEKAEVDLAGSPSIVVRARLRARDVVYCELQAHVALGETWVSLVVRGPQSERAACDETFERMLRSIAWRRD